MQFSDIREVIKALRLETLRTDCDNYFEAVIVKDELNKLDTRLRQFFGEAAWPSKERLPYQMQQVISGFGGIMPGQTLYYRNEASGDIFAMLWPWQDGLHTTVKIIQK